MAFKIFVHAVRLVLGHLGDALRIGGLLYVVQFATIMVVALLSVARMTSIRQFDPGLLFYFLVLFVVIVVTSIWIAVAWHRYVLLDEMPGAVIARFNGERMLAYFGRSLLLLLVAIGVLIVAGLVITFLGALLSGGATPSGPAGLLIQFVPILLVYVPVAIILYRLALVLPAAAVGKPIRLGEAWSATAGASGTIFGLAILTVLCTLVLDLPAILLTYGQLAWLSLIWQTLVGWIELMVGVSVLTTLYGHYVERRAIA